MAAKHVKCPRCGNEIALPAAPVPSVMCTKCYSPVRLLVPTTTRPTAPASSNPSALAETRAPAPALPPAAKRGPISQSVAHSPTVIGAKCSSCGCLLPPSTAAETKCATCANVDLHVATTTVKPQQAEATTQVQLTTQTAVVSPVKLRNDERATNHSSQKRPIGRWLIGVGVVCAALMIAMASSWSRPAKLIRKVNALDFVVTDCEAIVSARLANFWNLPLFQKFYQQTPEELRRQSEETVKLVGLGVENIDRVTVCFCNPVQQDAFAVVETNRDYGEADRKRLIESSASGAAVKWNPKTYRKLNYDLAEFPADSKTPPMAIHIANERLFVIGTENGVQLALDQFLDEKRSQKSDVSLASVIPWIEDGQSLFIAAGAITADTRKLLNEMNGPGGNKESLQRAFPNQDVISQVLRLRLEGGPQLPPQFQSLMKSDTSAIRLAVRENEFATLNARIHFPEASEASQAALTLSGLLTSLQMSLRNTQTQMKGAAGITAILGLAEFFGGLKVESQQQFVNVEGNFRLSDLPSDFKAVPGIQPNMLEIPSELTSGPHLRQLALACQAYQKNRGNFPPACSVDSSQMPLLSWRVAILPYLGDEEKRLYERFHLNEPWNSPHNIALSQYMPTAFEHPVQRIQGARTREFQGVVHGLTPFRYPVGKDAAFLQDRVVAPADIADGLDKTVMIIEQQPLSPWTQPEDVFVSESQIQQQILDQPSIVFGGPLNVVLFNGTLRTIPRSIKPQELWGMIAPRDGKGLPDIR